MGREEDEQDEVAAADGPPLFTGAGGISSVSGLSPGAIGVAPLTSEPATSTPLQDEEPERVIPTVALWAMKDRMHTRRPLESGEPGSVHARVGTGDATMFFIDDGTEHCMAARLVGRSPDGCVYCLVGRVSVYEYEQLRDQEVAVDSVFADARDISLCGVFDDPGASNVVVIEHYRHASSIPADYLPPSPFIEFSEAQGD